MSDLQYLTVEHLTLKYIKRIFSKIQRNPVTDCWEWTNRLVNGYGQFRYGKRFENAHRFLYAWLVGPIPRGRGKNIPQLDHIVCNNRRCVNPAHMILTTPQLNTLRSNAASAINARKTHCKHGHLLPEGPNRKAGSRQCNTCQRKYLAVWRKRWRAENPDYYRTDEYRKAHNERIRRRKLRLKNHSDI